MIEKSIEHLANQLNENKIDGQPGAIVLIGAGCSVTAGIPTANEIVKYVLERYKNNPDIQDLALKNPTYSQLMGCISPSERKKIFKHYVEDPKTKINVSHIYLAHLMEKGYVDYIVTVNFDNLAQRALALYNTFPPIYDISILNDFTTTSLDVKSITYLHGQYQGLWQLNTEEEMNKINKDSVAKSIFDKITNNRLWIVVGYSGEDFIFDQLIKLARFDNGLYWVGYKNNEPISRVQDLLLNKANTGSYWISGYDADSFFFKLNVKLGKLNAEIGEEHPKIFDTPMNFLLDLQKSIVDIDHSDDYRSIKFRFDHSKKMVSDAIERYEIDENMRSTELLTREAIKFYHIKKKLINCVINERYEELEELENQVKNDVFFDSTLTFIISDIYCNWGTYLGILAKSALNDEAEKHYRAAFEKFQKASQINPNDYTIYFYWGNYLGELAKLKQSNEAESLFNQAFEMYKKASLIKADEYEIYYNWGNFLVVIAQAANGEEAESYFKQAIDKYNEGIQINSSDHEIYNNLGLSLVNLAKNISGDDSDLYFESAFNAFKRAIELKPDHQKAYYNWGLALGNFAVTKSGDEAEKIFKEALKKYIKAIFLKADDSDTYFNWGNTLTEMAIKRIDQANVFEKESSAFEHGIDELFKQAFEKYNKAIQITPSFYTVYFNWGIHLGFLAKRKSGDEVGKLFEDAFNMFKKVTQIKSDYYQAYLLWGFYLGELAIRIGEFELSNSGFDAVELIEQAVKKICLAIDLGASSYNLIYLYVLVNKLYEVFISLEYLLENKQITFLQIENDLLFDNLREDSRYLALKAQYSKEANN